MASLYKALQKAIPICESHSDQAHFYNVDQHKFVCQQCLDPVFVEQTFQFGSLNNQSTQSDDTIFTLKQIVANPILLMLRQNSFLSQISPQANRYHIDEFLKILTDIDSFVKTKKSSIQCTKELMIYLKESITKKLDSIISKSEENLVLISQIEDNAQYLKRINTDYSNQFLETLQETYLNGTTQELKELLKKYSIQNENPFRRIQEKVIQIVENTNELKEINWEGCLELEKKITDPYIWSDEKLFLLKSDAKTASKKQENVILPDGFPHLLGFSQEQPKNYQNQPAEQSCLNSSLNIYVKCSENTMELMLKDHLDDFEVVDSYVCKDGSMDMLYELPNKILMAVSYGSIRFYSYQFNKIHFLEEISSIKGCNDVLIFEDFCVILAENSLYQIRYTSLSKVEEIKPKVPDTQEITELQYLYENQRKAEKSIIIKTQNKCNGQSKNLKLNIC